MRDYDVELFYSERETRPLSAEEEQVLIRRAQGGDQVAREEVIRRNLRFVVTTARLYHNEQSSFDIEDLVGEGNLGLIQALDRFDPDLGYKFITYAVWWIRQAISYYVQNSLGAVRRPPNHRQDRRDLEPHIAKLTQELERTPTELELASVSDLPIHKIKRALHERLNDYYLDKPMFGADADEATYGERVLVNHEEADELIQSLERQAVLEYSMEVLDDRERRIIRAYFGLDDGKGLPLQHLAEVMGITRERVRQIRNKALEKMRGRMRLKRLA